MEGGGDPVWSTEKLVEQDLGYVPENEMISESCMSGPRAPQNETPHTKYSVIRIHLRMFEPKRACKMTHASIICRIAQRTRTKRTPRRR
jgi:hypothetical protein